MLVGSTWLKRVRNPPAHIPGAELSPILAPLSLRNTVSLSLRGEEVIFITTKSPETERNTEQIERFTIHDLRIAPNADGTTSH